jgi:predicted amidophosphoribosyltransferase
MFIRGECREARRGGKRLLLFDDPYGSGATVRTIVAVLLEEGGAKAVHLLTLTKKVSG